MLTLDTPVLNRRSLVATGLGLVAFLLVGFVVSVWHRASAPMPDIAVMSEKLADYAALEPRPDIVFLGSSQTFRHIDPAMIDSGLEACGLAMTSYNFGVPALREPELRFIARDILAQPVRPRLVVIQNPLRAETESPNMMSARGRFFRGGEHLGPAMQDVQCYTGTRYGRTRSLLNNLRAMLAEGFGLGRLADAVIPADPPAPPAYNEAYRRASGFHPVELDGNDHVVARLTQSPMTDEILAAGRAGAGFVPSSQAADCRARQLTETLDAFRDAGVAVAYFVSPAPLDIAHDGPVTAAVRARNPSMPVLDFNTETTAQHYFQPGLWYDQAHMNGDGARQLSGEIAAALCPLLQDGAS